MTPFPRDPYRQLSPYAPDRRPIEVDLSDNTSRWGPHPKALRVIREADPDDLVRYPSVYADRLRSAVARRYGVPEAAVATGCGSDDLLDSTFRAAGEPGEAVAFMPPTFSMVDIFAHMNGMEARAVPAGEATDPRALLSGSPAIVYVCRPNNPTGEVLPREWVQELCAAAEPSGPIVLLDEAYVDFADDTFLPEAASSQRLVVVRTLSKVYGLAGLRVGFAVGAPPVIAEIEKSRGPYKVSRLAERAAIAVLEDEDEWAPRIVADVRRGRARLESELERRELRPLPSGANFLLLPLARGATAAGTTAALRELGIAVRPFPDLPGIGEAIRISVGPAHEIDRFLQAWDQISS